MTDFQRVCASAMLTALISPEPERKWTVRRVTRAFTTTRTDTPPLGDIVNPVGASVFTPVAGPSGLPMHELSLLQHRQLVDVLMDIYSSLSMKLFICWVDAAVRGECGFAGHRQGVGVDFCVSFVGLPGSPLTAPAPRYGGLNWHNDRIWSLALDSRCQLSTRKRGKTIYCS